MQSFLVRQGLSLKIVRCYNRCCLFGYLKVVVFFWGGGGGQKKCACPGVHVLSSPHQGQQASFIHLTLFIVTFTNRRVGFL